MPAPIRASAECPHLHRVRLARAVHPQPAAQAAASELAGFKPEFTVINLPSFRADPKRHGVRTETVIACNFAKRLVLIGGTSYAGETKKSVFTYLNYRHARAKA